MDKSQKKRIRYMLNRGEYLVKQKEYYEKNKEVLKKKRKLKELQTIADNYLLFPDEIINQKFEESGILPGPIE